MDFRKYKVQIGNKGGLVCAEDENNSENLKCCQPT